jgi:hypothetical protein
MTTLMHPQVILAWLLNDEPIPPQHDAPLRLIVLFRYGAQPESNHGDFVHRDVICPAQAMADVIAPICRMAH